MPPRPTAPRKAELRSAGEARTQPPRGRIKHKRAAAPVRYSARAYAGSKIVEIAIGANLQRVLARARRHHEKHGGQAWVWNVRTGETLHRIGGEIAVAA